MNAKRRFTVENEAYGPMLQVCPVSVADKKESFDTVYESLKGGQTGQDKLLPS